MSDADFDKLSQQLIRIIKERKDFSGVRKVGYSYVDIVKTIEELKKNVEESHLQNKFAIMDTRKRVSKLGKFDIFLP